jgi:intein-encoded DNA endonuclease-like protein
VVPRPYKPSDLAASSKRALFKSDSLEGRVAEVADVNRFVDNINLTGRVSQVRQKSRA